MSTETRAASRSLSPNRISWVATVSFSFTIGRMRRSEQPLHGALGVGAVGRVLQVAGGEQHLAGDDAVAVEAVLVAVDEHVLADGRRGLLRREVDRAGVELEVRHAGGDGAGRDQHDLRAAARGLAARASTSGAIWSAFAPLIEDDPTFTTIRARRAATSCLPRGRYSSPAPSCPSVSRPTSPAARSASSSARASRLRVHPLEVAARAALCWSAGPRLSKRGSVPRLPYQLGRRGERRLPVEHDRSDDHRRSGHRPDLEQLVFDAELGEAVGEEADGLLVLEVGLLHPALGLGAEHAVDVAVAAALDADRELAARSTALRADDDALLRRRGGHGAARSSVTTSASANDSWRRPSWLTAEISKTR